MDFLRTLFSRLTSLFRRSADADLDDELRAHIDLATAENLRKGLPAASARQEALRAFGGLTQTREAYRTQRGVPFLPNLARDLRFALRQLHKSPGFALTAIFTLALAIGAVTSVFSIVNTVLLKPFAFRDPGRLIIVRESVQEMGIQTPNIPVNYRHYLRLRHDSRSLQDAAIFQEGGLSISPTGDRPHLVGCVRVSPNFLPLLGVQPALGRNFVAADAAQGAPSVIVLTDDGWQDFFARNPQVIGKTLRISGEPATVIGVLPPGVRFPHIALAPNLAAGPTLPRLAFVPIIPNKFDLERDMGNFNYSVIARLKPGVSIAQASAELETLQRAYTVSAHFPAHLGINVTPLAKDATSNIRDALWLLFAAVGGVLLIACVNLANLQLARAVSAERETAVRAALGATTARLLINRFAESLILAIGGGLAGTALAYAGMRLLIALVPANVPRLNEVTVNLPVLLFAAGVSIASALSFGILPALRSLRVHPQSALQANSSRSLNSREGQRTRSILVTLQVACTIVLLIVTSLVLRSFSHLLSQNRGFDSSHVTIAQADLFAPLYSDKNPNVNAVKLSFVDRSFAALQQIPGVQSVALTSAVPLNGETWVDGLTRPDHPVPPSQQPLINVRWISPSYLSTMQIPLIAGRNFTTADRANPNIALISERTASEGFRSENPIGKKISDIIPDSQNSVTIVGVVADTHINGLKNSAAMVYLPYYAYTPWGLAFLVRSSQSSDAVVPEIRRALWGIDPQITIPILKSMDDQVSESVATDRLQAIVLSSFGAAALLLALLGVYGVLAYSVTLRRQEFGIRIALGSGRAALMRLVLLQAAIPVLSGTGIGLALAAIALRLLRSLLYQTSALDPLAIGASILLLLTAAALAAFIPARHAASIDPMRALRTE
ncbi:MAG TPA: ABC transporter permease [Terracidiphilus sp.]|nr:ABC transporter permease [Terracidiphilus sp.]